MRTRMAACLLFAIAVGTSGCLTNPYMRLPQLQPRALDVEERASEFHDPFPDASSGPDISGRPRGYDIPRTAPRRAADLRGVHLLDPKDPLPDSREEPPKRYTKAVSTD